MQSHDQSDQQNGRLQVEEEIKEIRKVNHEPIEVAEDERRIEKYVAKGANTAAGLYVAARDGAIAWVLCRSVMGLDHKIAGEVAVLIGATGYFETDASQRVANAIQALGEKLVARPRRKP